MYSIPPPTSCHPARLPFTCSTCGQCFKFNSKYVEHVNAHMNLRQYKCELCTKGFNNTKNLRAHAKTHQDRSERSQYKCELCPSSFIEASALKRHVESHMNLRQYVCDTCGSSFNTLCTLKNHTSVHFDRELKCSQCPRSFKAKRSLNNHIKNIHATSLTTNPLACSVCEKVLPSHRGLSEHLKWHSDSDCFKCKSCSKTYKTSSGMYSHMGRIHGISLKRKLDDEERSDDRQPKRARVAK